MRNPFHRSTRDDRTTREPLPSRGQHAALEPSRSLAPASADPGPPGAPRPTFAPIVVDLPVTQFEPRPPNGSVYRPDLVLDGWSTDHADVRVASVRGYAHRYYCQPRQDDVALAFHETTAAVVFAVADGVGNAKLPEIGARLACETAVNLVMAGLDESGHVDWRYLANSVSFALQDRANGTELPRSGVEKRVAEDYATTLVTGHVLPSEGGLVATMIQIGDSGAWLLRDGRFTDVITAKTPQGAAVVDSAVAALPRVPDPVRPVQVEVGPGAVLLVGTDGIGDPLGDGTGLVGDLFRTLLRTPPRMLEFGHAVDFSRETFDDDRTLLAIWPRCASRQCKQSR